MKWIRREGPLTDSLRLAPGGTGLGHVPFARVPDATAPMVCGFCSTGCGLNVHLKDGVPVGLTPDVAYPVNRGHACPKGWEALVPLGASDRATTPLLLQGGPGGRRVPVSWDQALQTFVSRFKGIQERHGQESVAFLSSGQIVTEEMALLGALAKFGMGLRHGDGNTRQCMATAVTAYKQSFGFDAPPYTYADLEASDTIVLVGSNLAIAHPILWKRVQANRHRPRLLVIDPRATETAMAATAHYAIQPKSDLVLFYALAHVLCARGWIDEAFVREHTEGFEAFRAHVADFPPERAARATGLPIERIEELARHLHEGERVSFWWTMGVNQSHEGVRVAQAIINLALMTGNIGRPGTGANSVTGQCNAMGSRLFSNTTNLLGGHDFANAADRAKVAGVLGFDEARLPTDAGWAYDQIIEGIASRKIRGLWIIATNPAHSWINHRDLHELLDRLDFLVVQDMYHSTETARRAHLLLPAAAWGEKEGTFINSERRIGRVKKVARPPGEALADFDIFRLIAEHWGVGEMFETWRSPEGVFGILRRLSAGQPCDLSGVTGYDMLEAEGGVQWPFAKPADGARPDRERRLFSDGRFFHKDGRARFIYDAPRPLPESPSRDYPLLLLTGRGSASEWHTRTRTAKSAVLRRLAPAELELEINPADARRIGVRPHAWVKVSSQRGVVKARAFVTPTVRPGQVFLPMHDRTVNRLTFPAFDPHSRQPAYKASAVRVEPWKGEL